MFSTPIVRVQSCETHPDKELEHLSIVRIKTPGNIATCIAGKEEGNHRYPEGTLVLFCPINTIIPKDFLKFQGYYWDEEKDRGLLKGSQRNRVGATRRGSVTSEGLLFPTIQEGNETFMDITPSIRMSVYEGLNLSLVMGMQEFDGAS